MTRQGVLKLIAVAAIVLALLAAFAVELADTQAKSRDDVKARVHERAQLAAALIDSLFESSAQQAPLNGRLYGGAEVSDSTLEAKRAQNQYLVLLGTDGRVIARSKGLTPTVLADVTASPAVRSVVRGRAYGIGDVLPYAKSGVISYSVGFATPSGRRTLVTGFTPAVLDGLFNGELRKIPGVRGARNYIIDGALTVLSSTNPARKVGDVFRDPEQVQALTKPSGSRGGFYFDQVRVANSGWRVVLAAPEGKLFATVSGLRKWVPWALFAAFALVTLIAFALARRALRASEQVRDANGQLGALNAELEETNAMLARRAAELARSNDELEQFASIASHDLQEPLRKVRTFSQQLTVIEADRLSDKGRDYLERTNAAAERMQRLIEDLLRFSRVATRTRPFEQVDLDEVLREVLVDLELEVERAGAHVTVEPLGSICGDASQLRQLLQNLVSNALKFRRDDVPAEVAISARTTDDVATISVRDNGIGFEPQYEQRIFRVFERLHGRGKYPGTGIGLALCRKIVERHGGTILAQGALGEGSTFVITLPVDQREEVIAGPTAPGRPDASRDEDHAYA